MPPSRRIVDGPLAREIARFGTPLALGTALQTTFNLVDAYLVAQLPASEVGPAIGALGVCDQLAAIGTIVSYGISTATGALLSHHKGADNTEAIRRTAWQSLLLVLALSLFFGVGGVLFAGPIVRDVVGAKGEVANVATSYLRVVMGGSFTIFFLFQLTSIQRALGSSKTPVSLMVAGNVINVLFAIVLIYGPTSVGSVGGHAPSAVFRWGGVIATALHIPKMGMLGAAWATIFARSLALIPMCAVVAYRFKIVLPEAGARGPERVEMGRLLSIAWPSSTQFVLRIAGMLLLNSLVARFFTTDTDQTATTAIGIVFRLDTMALYVAMGWGSAAQTFVGQNLGAGKEARAIRSGWVTVVYDTIANLVLIAAVFTVGQRILRVFDDDPAPLAIATQYLYTVAPSYLCLGAAVVLGNAMAGAGATRTTMWVDVAVILGFQFPLCIVAVAGLGTQQGTLFRCVAATNVVSAGAYALVYLRGGWRRSALGHTILAKAPVS